MNSIISFYLRWPLKSIKLYYLIPEPLPLPQRAAAFIDLQDNKVDQEAGSLLSHFRDQLALPRLERSGGVCKGRSHFMPLSRLVKL